LASRDWVRDWGPRDWNLERKVEAIADAEVVDEECRMLYWWRGTRRMRRGEREVRERDMVSWDAVSCFLYMRSAMVVYRAVGDGI
jgi:hypothetical protein